MKPDSIHSILAWVAALFLASCLFSHTVALRLLLLAAGIVLASIVAARRGDGIRTLPPIWLPFLIWGLWAAASIGWSVEPDRSEKEWSNEVFYTGAALWICYVSAQVRAAPRILAGVVACAAVAACVTALYEYSQGLARYAAGIHGGSGNHSSALIVAMPCALAFAWYQGRVRRERWTALAALALSGLFLASAYTTLNRTIWLAFALQFALFGALLLGRGVRRSAPTLLIVGIAALGACTAMILSIQAERGAIGYAKGLEKDSRLALWPEVVERVAERPFTGYGFGRGVLRSALQEDLGSVDKYLWHAHNLFLEALLQVGVPGLLLLLLLLGEIVREAWRLARGPDDWAVACGIALLAVVAGTLVRNMTDTLLVRQNALLYWGFVGALLGLSRGARGPAA